MKDNLIYETIAKRTGGDIYVGVVGPVRTGKSTFIHKMLEHLIIPNIENEFDRERTVDEIPQSASGKTITTTEPKFIPSEAVGIRLGDARLRVKLIDSVGYMVDGALGSTEGESERMVMTPWSESPMPFSQASEIGTGKVLSEHSTVAMLVSCDGTVCDIPRENYIAAEERTVAELKKCKKPFAIILNSSRPESAEAHALARELEEKYSSPVALVNCALLNGDDISAILSLVIGEFPLTEIKIKLPDWLPLIPAENPLSDEIGATVTKIAESMRRLSDAKRYTDNDSGVRLVSLSAECGVAELEIPVDKDTFLSVMSETTGLSLRSDRELFSVLTELAEAKRDYDKISSALADARECGYGIVLPTADELRISEPKSVKSGGSWGVKLTASADAIHIIKTDVVAQICPVIGTEEQSTQVVGMMLDDYEENPRRILTTKMLGRSILDLVNDSIESKVTRLNADSREKLAGALGKIVNEGSDGLICILV